MPASSALDRKAIDDAEDDVELEHARQPPAIGGRRDLRDVERRGDRRNADAQSRQ